VTIESDESRKIAEREFHNQREQIRKAEPENHDTYYTNRRFYRTTGKSRNYIDAWFQKHCPKANTLDYCCGTGENAIKMAQFGAQVDGVDISDVSIETAHARALALGLSDQISFTTMDAENLVFPDNSFDVVLCSGVLHHLDLDNAYQELARVVKPNGKILCVEALSDNPLIHLYRKRTPHLRTVWEVDHILTSADIHKAKKYFRNVEVRYFHLASIAAIPFINTPIFKPAMTVLNALDEVLMRVPGVQQMAWQAVFVLSEPN